MFKDTVAICRSYRRFHQDVRIPHDTLIDWVDTARLVSSSGNRQPLRYAVVSEPDMCSDVFACCAWAAALPDWPGPDEGERPSAYIIIAHDETRALGEKFTAWDEGIAAQTIMLAAADAGYGGCIIASIKKKSLSEVLGIDSGDLECDIVIALGKPKEDVRFADLPEDGSTAYWRDEDRVHHVPKRALEDILIR